MEIRIKEREGQRLFGKVKSGQIWKKRDQGQACRIINRAKDRQWSVLYFKKSGNRTHHIREHDLYKFYERIV